MRALRALVVDDSAYNRRTIAELLSSMPGVEIVGKAADGDEALKLVSQTEPDLITLDLEMPRMDGFKFLRLLMARRPTPVIVVSGYSQKENVFRALELGALDFVAKPTRTVASDLKSIQEVLAEKVEMVRHLAPAGFDPRRRGTMFRGATATGAFPIMQPDAVDEAPKPGDAPKQLVVIGASTGGPTALVELFARLPARACVLVVQHMPERFTRTFAQRLDRLSRLEVREAEGGDVLRAGMALVCPGGRCLEVVREGSSLVAKVVDPSPSERYIPSADRLFETAAVAMGDRIVGIILTGMGDDGARGVTAVRRAGGRVLAEGPETAVIYGMPGAAVRTGDVDRSLPLPSLAEHLAVLLA